jgi:hypothetical protein
VRAVRRLLTGPKEPRPLYRSHDLRPQGLGPLEAFYEHGGEPCLVSIELRHCRWFGASGLSYARDGAHPYVQTLIAYARGGPTTFEGSSLEAFWNTWHPANLAEYLGLDPATSHPLLVTTPAIHGIVPWSPGTEVAAMRERSWLERPDYRALHEAGCPPARSCGPKPTAFGVERFGRLVWVYERIVQEGYREAPAETLRYRDQHIVGACLVRDGEVRLLVADGQHRAAALAALGGDRAPVLVHVQGARGPTVVRRDDVEAWPLVRLGLFTTEDATRIFDRIFEGQMPADSGWPAAAPPPDPSAADGPRANGPRATEPAVDPS